MKDIGYGWLLQCVKSQMSKSRMFIFYHSRESIKIIETSTTKWTTKTYIFLRVHTRELESNRIFQLKPSLTLEKWGLFRLWVVRHVYWLPFGAIETLKTAFYNISCKVYSSTYHKRLIYIFSEQKSRWPWMSRYHIRELSSPCEVKSNSSHPCSSHIMH